MVSKLSYLFVKFEMIEFSRVDRQKIILSTKRFYREGI